MRQQEKQMIVLKINQSLDKLKQRVEADLDGIMKVYQNF